jgi:hypothetical protein
MKKKTWLFGFLFLTFFCLLFTPACFKKSANAAINNNFGDSITTIKNLRKMHNVGMAELIGQPIFIQGTVVANDEHDNIYKSIFVQDKTGGIVITMDGLSLYQNYPIGTLVKINTQNLFLTDYRHMTQLVASVDSSSGSLVTTGIPSPLFPKHVQIISDNEPITPILVGFKNLTDTLQGRLIQISMVEFSAADTGQTYADKKNKLGLSRSLKFCSGGTIYMRTSGYADFAGVKTQPGNGIVIGVYSVYNNEKQIILRDTNDILLTAKRCTGAAWLQNLPQTAPKSPN